MVRVIPVFNSVFSQSLTNRDLEQTWFMLKVSALIPPISYSCFSAQILQTLKGIPVFSILSLRIEGFTNQI